MNDFQFTLSQKKRLKELGADNYINSAFRSEKDRNSTFDDLDTAWQRKNKEAMQNLLLNEKRPLIRRIESKIIESLNSNKFVEITTPYIISRVFIEQMGINETNHLWKQIYWLEDGRCLRPMLAPNLYYIMRCLRKFMKPVRIFEVGPCFRKESKGWEHIEGFTMLNVVELAPEKEPLERVKEIIDIVLEAVELPNFQLKDVKAEVYGRTVDVIIDEIEVASAVAGPHQLDKNWGIFEAWAGVGFGIERIAMVKKGSKRIKSVARSLSNLDGIPLDIQ